MYVVIDKKTRRITHINHAPFKQELTDERQYYRIDAKTMDMGHADADPTCQSESRAADGSAEPEAEADSDADLEARKRDRVEHFSRLALQERQRILPDYKLQNASLGIYDERRTANYRATVQAFRDEFHRLEALVHQARSATELQAIEPHFPDALTT